MDFMFQIFPVFFFVTFALVFGTIIFTMFKGVTQWNKNNHSPRLTVDATVIAKRTEVFRRRRGNSSLMHSATTYYATFQVESGDRFELQLQGQEYGLLLEGDRGKLTFQGTRFLEFQRT